jgi:Ca2+-binding RTX toxin-like protein
MKLIGTAGADNLTGGADNDIIKGLGGDDDLLGGDGADKIFGGSGQDILAGGAGSDLMKGGADGDFLDYGAEGDDTVLGGAGDDTLSGDDSTTVRRVILDGGAGEDVISLSDRFGVTKFAVKGGDGADEIRSFSAASAAIDAGAGGDFVYLQFTRAQLTLGAGHDYVQMGNVSSARVLDFAASGSSSDALVLCNYFGNNLSGWNGETNPFAGGYASIVQDGTDAVLRVDPNGGGDSWYELVRLKNVDASMLTAANLSGYARDGGAIANLVLTGGIDADWLIGGGGDDLIKGDKGDDNIVGQLGDDRLFGGSGADRVTDDSGGDDALSGGSGDDVLTIIRSNFDAGPETILLDGGAGADQLYYITFNGAVSDIAALGGDGNDWFALDKFAAATVTGGAGADSFHLSGGPTTFVYLDASDSTANFRDDIDGFRDDDTIDLSKVDANVDKAGDQAFIQVVAFSSHAGELVVSYDAGQDRTMVDADVDGDGVGDLEIVIDGDHSGFTNFVL